MFIFTTCTFSVNTKRYWFPCQNTWVLWDCYLYKQWHCEQNPVSFNTRECICKYGIEFINILLFADKGLNFKHLSSSESCPTPVLTDVLLNCLPISTFLHPNQGHKPNPIKSLRKDSGNFTCIPLETIAFDLWHRASFPQINETLWQTWSHFSTQRCCTFCPPSPLMSLCLCDSCHGTWQCVGLAGDIAGLRSLYGPVI